MGRRRGEDGADRGGWLQASAMGPVRSDLAQAGFNCDHLEDALGEEVPHAALIPDPGPVARTPSQQPWPWWGTPDPARVGWEIENEQRFVAQFLGHYILAVRGLAPDTTLHTPIDPCNSQLIPYTWDR